MKGEMADSKTLITKFYAKLGCNSTEHSHRGAIRLFGEQSYVRMSCIGERLNHFGLAGDIHLQKEKNKQGKTTPKDPDSIVVKAAIRHAIFSLLFA
jgi:hypothetical protein